MHETAGKLEESLFFLGEGENSFKEKTSPERKLLIFEIKGGRFENVNVRQNYILQFCFCLK